MTNNACMIRYTRMTNETRETSPPNTLTITTRSAFESQHRAYLFSSADRPVSTVLAYVSTSPWGGSLYNLRNRKSFALMGLLPVHPWDHGMPIYQLCHVFTTETYTEVWMS
jgi:hypothetical protein